MRHWQRVIAVMLIGLLIGLAAGCDPPFPTAQPQDLPGATSTAFPTPATDAEKARSEMPTIVLPTGIPTLVVTAEPEIGLMIEEEALTLAKETLAQELGVDEEEIAVERAEPVRWRDTSLGCPQKGMMYAQVITPGYRVWLQVEGKTYDVHVGSGRAVVCESASKIVKTPPAKEIATAARMYELARQDLAARLSVDVEEIKGNFIKPTTWPDTSLGCPQAGEVYAQVLTEGFLIELECEGQTYEYHTDMERVLLCEKP